MLQISIFLVYLCDFQSCHLVCGSFLKQIEFPIVEYKTDDKQAIANEQISIVTSELVEPTKIPLTIGKFPVKFLIAWALI